MLRVAIGSKNPAKLIAVRAAFERIQILAEIVGVDVPSGVSNQPFSDEETIAGAVNRAKAAVLQDFDYGIGLEGGVVQSSFGLFLCNWGAVVNQKGEIGIGGGHRLQLPEEVAIKLRAGNELGDIIDQWSGGTNIRKREGTIGVLTHNHITRAKMFEDVVICSFARFME